MDCYDKFLDNSVWIIANGRKINFWLDNWAGEILAFKYKILDKCHYSLPLKIDDSWSNNTWSFNSNVLLALPNLLTTISPFSISKMEIEDSLARKIWKMAISLSRMLIIRS